MTLNELEKEHWWHPPESLKDLKEIALKMKNIGNEVYFADISSELGAIPGFVVKAVVPKLIPLSQNHSIRWLNSERIMNHMGSDFNKVNKYPHPFA